MAQVRSGVLAGRYRLESVLGRGGMGVVHRATDTRLGRPVAVKVISGASAEAEEARARFAREVEALARLDSPHVVTIVDHGEDDDGAPYLVTQLVPGGDLGSLLREGGGLPPATAVRVVAQVLDALRDAHRAGVVHRDVKPANVLLRDTDPDALDAGDVHVYLCDFGIAQLAASDGLTGTGMVAGTWAYLPPERGRGEPASAASDTYAAGCLLWACLTGRPPYDGSDVEVALAHQTEPVPRLAWDDATGDALDEVLRRSMAKDPADRYAGAADMRAALLAVPGAGPGATPRSATARPTASRTTPRRTADAVGTERAGRRRWPWLVVVLAALLAGALGVALALRPDGAQQVADAPASPPDDRAEGVVGDVDGDGLGDLALSAVTSAGTTFTTYPGTGDGVGAPTQRAGIDTTAVPLRGDFDGDGTEEYVGITSTTNGALVLQPVGADGSWLVTGAGFEVPPVVGDFDSDGVADLAFLGYPGGQGLDATDLSGGEVRLALGGEDARVAEVAATGPWDPVADLLVPADLDGDSDDDLVLLRPQGGARGGVTGTLTLTALVAEGGRLTAGPESAPLAGLAGRFARPVDRDGDGRDEVALAPRAGGDDVRMFTLADSGAVTETASWGTVGGSEEPESIRAVGTTDLDGDGRDDLALVRAEALGGPVTGVEVMLAGDDGLAPALPLVDLAGTGVSTAKLADGSVNRPFGLDR